MIADMSSKLVRFANIDRYFCVNVHPARENIDPGKIVSEVRVQGIHFKEVSGAAVPNKNVLTKPGHADFLRLRV